MVHIQTHISGTQIAMHTAMSVAFLAGSFFIGMRSAGDVAPIESTQASDVRVTGDFSLDGVLTMDDAIVALEIAQGYDEPTIDQLMVDTDGDYAVTVNDAIEILRTLSL